MAEPRTFEQPQILSRSRRRFFFSFSLGLVVTPSSQESTLAIVTVFSSSGAFTRIRQSRGRPERHFRENTPAESGDGFDGGFGEALGWNPNRVLDTFRIGE